MSKKNSNNLNLPIVSYAALFLYLLEGAATRRSLQRIRGIQITVTFFKSGLREITSVLPHSLCEISARVKIMEQICRALDGYMCIPSFWSGGGAEQERTVEYNSTKKRNNKCL